MNATEPRNQTWERIQADLPERMARVLVAWRGFGIGTTRELAQWSYLDILNVRPRTSELCKAGLVECVGVRHGEGIYRAVSKEDWELSQDKQLALI